MTATCKPAIQVADPWLDACRAAIIRLDAGEPWSRIVTTLVGYTERNRDWWSCYVPGGDLDTLRPRCDTCHERVEYSVCPGHVRAYLIARRAT